MARRIPAVITAALISAPAWAVSTGSIPVECGSEAELLAMLREYDEKAVLMMSSHRMVSRQEVSVPAVLFINSTTLTWSLVEQVSEDVYCVVAQGEQIRSHRAPGGI